MRTLADERVLLHVPHAPRHHGFLDLGKLAVWSVLACLIAMTMFFTNIGWITSRLGDFDTSADRTRSPQISGSAPFAGATAEEANVDVVQRFEIPWPDTIEGLVLAKNEIIDASIEAHRAGRRDEALEALERLARAFEEAGEGLGFAAADALVAKGRLIESRDPRQAADTFERARRADPTSAGALEGLSNVKVTLGELDEAIVLARSAIDAAVPGDDLTIGRALGHIASVQLTRGQYDDAEETLAAAMTALAAAGDDIGLANLLNSAAYSLNSQGRYEDALATFEGLFGIAEEQQSDFVRLLALFGRAAVLENLERFEAAVSDYEAAISLARRLDDQTAIAGAHSNLGNIARKSGDLDRAEDHLLSAYTTHAISNDRLGEAIAMANLGDLSRQRGRIKAACDYWSGARSIFAAMNAVELSEVDAMRRLSNCPELGPDVTDWSTASWTAYLAADLTDLRRLIERDPNSREGRRAAAAFAYKDARQFLITLEAGWTRAYAQYAANFLTHVSAANPDAIPTRAFPGDGPSFVLDHALFQDELPLLRGESWRRNISDLDFQRLLWRHEFYQLANYATEQIWVYPDDPPLDGLFGPASAELDTFDLSGDYLCRLIFFPGTSAVIGIETDLDEHETSHALYSGQSMGCSIVHDGETWSLRKRTGTFHLNGRIYPSTERAMIFLGAVRQSFIDDRPSERNYGDDPYLDATGVFERVGDRRYRIGFPDPTWHGGDYVFLELTRTN